MAVFRDPSLHSPLAPRASLAMVRTPGRYKAIADAFAALAPVVLQQWNVDGAHGFKARAVAWFTDRNRRTVVRRRRLTTVCEASPGG